MPESLDDALLRKLIDSFPLPTYRWRRDAGNWRLVDCNPAGRAATRGTVERLLGSSLSKACADRPDVVGDFERCAASGSAIRRRIRCVESVGDRPRDLALTYVPLGLDLVLVHVNDLTERQALASRLEESETRAAAVLNGVSEGVIAIDELGTITLANRAAGTLFGYEPDELLGRNVKLLMTAPDSERHDGYLARYRETGEARIIGRGRRVAGLRKDGMIFPLFLDVAEVATGGSRQFVGLVRDLGPEERSRADLKESERRFRQLAESLQDAVFWIATPGNSEVLYLSPSFERVWGLARERLCADPALWIETIHPEDRVRVAETVRRQPTQHRLIQRIVRPDGSVRTVRVRVFPVRDDEGSVYRVAGIAEDITENERVRRELEKARRSLDDAQRLSHLGSWEWDIVHDTLWWSDEVYRIFGLEPRQFGATYAAFLTAVHPEDRAAVEAAVRDSLDRATPYAADHRVVRPDGEIRIVEERGEVHRSETGRPVRMIGTVHDVTQAREDETRLRESEERWRLAIAGINEGVWDWRDVTRDEEWLSPRFYELLGYAPEAGDRLPSFKELLHPDDEPRVAEAVRRHLEDGEHYDVEIRLRRSTGTWSWFRSRGTATRDESGRPARMVGGIEDITSERQAEEHLAVLSSAVEQTADHVFITDREGRIEFANPAFEKQTGFTLAEIRGRTPRILKSGQHPASFFKKVWDTILAGDVFRGVFINQTKNGETFYEEKTITPLRGHDGQITHFVSTGRDITRRHAAEEAERRLQEAIRRSAIEWRATFDSIDWPLVLVERGGVLRRLNRAASERLGGDYRKWVGRNLAEFAGEPWVTLSQAVSQAEAGDAAASLESPSGPDGTTWAVDVRGLGDPWGTKWSAVAMARDVTRFVRLQDSLRRHERMSAMGALVGGVAHEVRNPLFGISATLDAMEAEVETSPAVREFSGRLRTEVERLTELMYELLEYGRPAAAQLSHQLVEAPLRRAFQTCQRLADASGVTLKLEVPETPLSLPVDRQRLSTALRNLIENAIQHTPAEGEVRVSLSETEGGGAQFRIQDQGPGFHSDDADRLVEPFFTRRRGGTGLGLAIVQRIVEEHGGTLTLSNRSDAQGGLATVYIPARGPADTTRPPL